MKVSASWGHWIVMTGDTNVMPIDTKVNSVMRTTSELPLIEALPDHVDI